VTAAQREIVAEHPRHADIEHGKPQEYPQRGVPRERDSQTRQQRCPRNGPLTGGRPRRPGPPAAWCAAGSGPARRGPARGTSGPGSQRPGSASAAPGPAPPPAARPRARPRPSARNTPCTWPVPAPHRGHGTIPPAVRARTTITPSWSVASSMTRDDNPENTIPASPSMSHAPDHATCN
jgi:hypothetical protein